MTTPTPGPALVRPLTDEQLRFYREERDEDGERMWPELASNCRALLDQMLATISALQAELTALHSTAAKWESIARAKDVQVTAFMEEVSEKQVLYNAAIDRALEAEARVAVLVERKDGAYLERNQVVAALAKCFPSGTAKTAIEGWSEDWHGCVYINLPTGQVSWHYHDSQAYLFADLPPYQGAWDGHTTPEKYARLAALSATALLRERDEMRAALKPFAAAAYIYPGSDNDVRLSCRRVTSVTSTNFRLGDLRKARDVLASSSRVAAKEPT